MDCITAANQQAITLTPVATDFWYSVYAIAEVAGAISYTRHNALATLRLNVDGARFLSVLSSVSREVGSGLDPSMAFYIDGVYQHACTPGANNQIDAYGVTLDGAAHTVEIVEAGQSGFVLGTYVLKVNGRGISIVAPVVPTYAVAVYGDSITVGGIADSGASVGPKNGWVMQTRAAMRARGDTIQLKAEAWGGRSLNDDATGAHLGFANTTALATQLVSLVSGAANRILIDDIGTNDYGFGGGQQSAASYGTNLAALYDAVHAQDAGIRILARSLLHETSEGANANFANTANDYRSAKQTAATARPSFVTFVDGSTIITGSDLTVDGVHPNLSGHTKVATSTITSLRALGVPL